MLDLIQKERENTVAEFRELRRWLEEQKKLLLVRTKKTKNEIVAIRHIGLAKVKEELSSLEDLIQEMEKKHQQPASKLLQDIGSVLEKATLENLGLHRYQCVSEKRHETIQR
ncbi:tripartite motif-containing protein 15-like isoform X2 [Python bivittatus]|uniref:Tripartite motif-containing protein 15-like isoform X2 n=1 Tax=Python bivittatus TaxID=176946 RepID=A0A9F5IWA4_PYTBI|nr:tripartite motif-containing protein 15-like isoform X2 [Python bivittatus]